MGSCRALSRETIDRSMYNLFKLIRESAVNLLEI